MPKPQNKESDAPAAPHSLDLGPLPDLIGYVLRRTQLHVFKDFINTCAEADVRPGLFSVLTLIDRNPGARQGEIGRALGIKRPNTVTLVNDLEKRGLARRGAHATDRRAHALYLTEDGKALLVRLNILVESHEQRLIDAIGPDGRDQLVDLLYRLGNALDPSEQETL